MDEYEIRAMRERNAFMRLVILVALILVSIGSGLLYGCPKYRVWQKELSGEATLKEATWSRQVAVEEARAMRESSTLLAEAEVERAKGVAAANEIIGSSLKDNWEYLQYLAIQAMGSESTQLIYVPHSGGLPLLEATRNQRVVTGVPAK